MKTTPRLSTGAFSTGSLILSTVLLVSCGGEELDGAVGSPAGADGTAGLSEAELRHRIKARRAFKATRTPGSGGASGASGAVSTGGASGSGEPSGAVSTGGAVGSTGADGIIAVTDGGICPGNAALPEGAACGPYGITCTFNTASATHYCTCLNASATGKQGWGCH